jgi:[acyl-carrier-protein] S-malonyltransferase
MKWAWLFPGQGTQKPGMGRDLFDAIPEARAVFDAADQALGEPFSKLCFEGSAEDLTSTANAQPAILTHSIASLAALRAKLPDLPAPAFAAGHSLGEYSALVAAAALPFVDAVKLVRLRGRAMQQAVPEGEGAMAAILGADEASVRSLCDDARENDVLSPANFNAPGQIVIAGTSRAVDRARALASDRKLKAISLKVSAPFHCTLMRPAALAVETALHDVTLSPFQFPVVSNFEAQPNSAPERARELLVKQVDGSVLWEQSMRWMLDQGMTHAVEIGPGSVLSGLLRKIDKSVKVTSVGDLEGIEQLRALLANP